MIMKTSLLKYFMLATTLVASISLSAQTYNGGTWYSLYETGERTLSTIDSETLNAFTPVGTNLTFDAKRAATGQGNLKVAPIVNGQQQSDIFDQKPGKVTKKNFLGIESQVDYTDAPYSATVSNSNSNQIKFYTVTGATLNKYFKNVKLPLKKHILIADGGFGKEEESKSFGNVTIGNVSAAQTVKLRSFLTTGNITITSNNPAFRVGSSSNQGTHVFNVGANACASTNGASGTPASGGTLGDINLYDINIYFVPTVAGEQSGTITISDDTSSATISVSGVGIKKTQTIAWAEALNGDSPTLPIGKKISSPANAQTEITYSVENDTIISINGNTLTALKTGTTTITATAAETNEWLGVTSTITVKVTEKKVQSILWSDNLTGFKVGDEPFTLTATASVLVDAEKDVTEAAPERNQYISYQSAKPAVVSVDGNTLYIQGEGETTLTATLQGDDFYEAATLSMAVRVRVSSTTCELYVLEAPEEFSIEYSLLGQDRIYEPAAFSGPAHILTFDARKQKDAAVGNIQIQQYVNGNWQDIDDANPGTDWRAYRYELDRKATKIRFYNGYGSYKRYFKNVLVSQATYLETTAQPIIVEKSIIGDEITRTIAIQYSNIPAGVIISNNAPEVVLSDYELGNDCGTHGEKQITVTIRPTEIGVIEDIITIHDEATGTKLEIPVTVHVQRNTQTITWEQELSALNTTDNITLSAEAKTSIYYTSSDSTIAYAEDNHLVINKYGQFTLTAVAVESEKYEQATATKTITISKATPVLEELPIATSITYGSTLGTSILEGGSTNVDGTWEWNADVAQVLNAGINDISVLFTPANTAWYSLLEVTVSLTVNKADQTLAWDFADQTLTAGSTLTLNATATCGEVTYTISDNDGVVTLDGTTLTAHKAGVVTIQASHAGDANHNAVASATYTITIVHATPSITAWPTLADVTYGATLEQALVLVGGEASVEGEFAITDELELATVPNAGTYTYNVTFTPEATEKYNTVSGTVALTVNKADQVLTWDFADQTLTAGSTLTLNASATCGEVTYTISDNDGVVTLDGTTLTAHKAGTVILQASHAGDANHNAVASAIYTITVVHATPVVTEWPTLAAVTYGATLEQALTLVGGEASVDGEFVLNKPADLTVVPSAGNHDFVVTFVPTDSEAYASLADTVVLTVNQASQEISWGLGNISLAIGEEIVLDATASSNLAVSYVIEGDANIVVIEEEIYLVAKGEGTVTITAVQEGNNDYLAAETISYVINVYDPSGETTNLDNVISPATTTTKCIIDGRLYIVRDGKYYDAAGRMVK